MQFRLNTPVMCSWGQSPLTCCADIRYLTAASTGLLSMKCHSAAISARRDHDVCTTWDFPRSLYTYIHLLLTSQMDIVSDPPNRLHGFEQWQAEREAMAMHHCCSCPDPWILQLGWHRVSASTGHKAAPLGQFQYTTHKQPRAMASVSEEGNVR